MPITFGQARSILAPYAGVSGLDPASEDTELFVKTVLDYMLITGDNGGERMFEFYAVKGWITLPYELETPLKIKIGDSVGSVWGKWFEWRYGASDAGSIDASNALTIDDVNTHPTVYDLPQGGGHPAILGFVDEEPDAHAIISGIDMSNTEIFTTHQGQRIGGEYLSIERGRLKAANTRFSKITSITMTKTNGYKQLFCVDSDGLNKQFLSAYTPYEEVPEYKRAKLSAKCADIVKVSILGRIRLKEYYADSDPIPVRNLYALHVAGQGIQASRQTDNQTAQAKDATLTTLIDRSNSNKQVNNGQPMVDVYRPLSNGSIKRLF